MGAIVGGMSLSVGVWGSIIGDEVYVERRVGGFGIVGREWIHGGWVF